MKSLLKKIINRYRHTFSSIDYWENRYRSGGNSGSGSYNQLAQFKAAFINDFIASHQVQSAIEFGCGDGHQLSLIQYPHYIGIDVSMTSIQHCKKKFSHDQTRNFFHYNPFSFGDPHGVFKAEISISLDVIYHLVENEIYEYYMQHLFQSALHYVIIYSTNEDQEQINHERGRKFTTWVDLHCSNWVLYDQKENPFKDEIDPEARSSANFFIYKKI